MISEVSGIQLGFAIAIFTAVLGGLRWIDSRIDSRFNALEFQMKEALRGRLTRQEHRIWVLEFRVRNPTLSFPDAMGESESGE